MNPSTEKSEVPKEPSASHNMLDWKSIVVALALGAAVIVAAMFLV